MPEAGHLDLESMLSRREDGDAVNEPLNGHRVIAVNLRLECAVQVDASDAHVRPALADPVHSRAGEGEGRTLSNGAGDGRGTAAPGLTRVRLIPSTREGRRRCAFLVA